MCEFCEPPYETMYTGSKSEHWKFVFIDGTLQMIVRSWDYMFVLDENSCQWKDLDNFYYTEQYFEVENCPECGRKIFPEGSNVLDDRELEQKYPKMYAQWEKARWNPDRYYKN